MFKKLDKGFNFEWNYWVTPYRLFWFIYINKLTLFQKENKFKITFKLPILLYKAIHSPIPKVDETDFPIIKFRK